MAVTLSVVRSVKYTGCKGEWVIKGADMKECDGNVFVKLSTQNSSLSTMLGNKGGFRCLNRSVGFRNLKQLRNDHLKADSPAEDDCTLFDDAAPKPSPSKNARVRPADHCVEVEIEIDGVATAVKLLVSSYRDDPLFIAFEDDTVHAVIKYILDNGFDVETPCKSKRKGEEALPAGIWRHSKGFTVNYTDDMGIKRQKFTTSMDKALKIYAGEIKPAAKEDDLEELHES